MVQVSKTAVSSNDGKRRHALELLEYIGTILTEGSDLRVSGRAIVQTIANHLAMEVCSIYLCDPQHEELVLWATTGLEQSSVGTVRMKIDEGLTGIVVQKRQPVMAVDALAHPRYKYFPESGEERFHSFLGIPVIESGQLLGVMNVQTQRRRRFAPQEVRLLKALAVPIASLLRQVQLHSTLALKEEERQHLENVLTRMTAVEPTVRSRDSGGSRWRLVGLSAAPGFGIGEAHLISRDVDFTSAPRLRRGGAQREKRRIRVAIEHAIEDLISTRDQIRHTIPEVDAAVFDAQRMILEDASFVGRLEKHIEAGLTAEAALGETVNELVGEFTNLNDAYLRDRATDIKDIGQRVLRHLLGVGQRLRTFASPTVLVADEISLSDIALVEHDNLKGIVIASGGVTSHASILAKSLEIPTVVGAQDAHKVIAENDPLIVDGNAGVVYVHPTAEVQREYTRLDREYRAFNRDLESLRDLPAQTLDGHRVGLLANVALLSDIGLARTHGAEGVGLYRTEMPFLSHRDFLTEDEQYEIYRRVVTEMSGRPVTFRTLDLGADKHPAYLNIPPEDNPFLGWRSTRVSLEMPDIFKVQLRAILRASAAGPSRVMFPMISSIDEIRQVKWLLNEAMAELYAEGREYDASIPVGMMVEVPSAVYLAPQFAKEVDFFSIGTNDLIQYILAVDRSNRKVGPLYEPLHPAVLQSIASAVSAAKVAGKSVSICGEMAADATYSVVLLGMGLDFFSLSAFFIPAIKRVIRSVNYDAVQRLAAEVLGLSTVGEVKSCVFETMRSLGLIDVIEMYH